MRYVVPRMLHPHYSLGSAALALWLLLVLPEIAFGASPRMDNPPTVDKLLDEATFIFSGTVTSVRFATIDSEIYTYVDLAVDDILKGSASDSVVTIRVLGGQASPDSYIVYDHMPSFEVEGRYLLFAVPTAPQEDPSDIVRGAYGQLTFEDHPVTGEPVLTSKGLAVVGIEPSGSNWLYAPAQYLHGEWKSSGAIDQDVSAALVPASGVLDQIRQRLLKRGRVATFRPGEPFRSAHLPAHQKN